MLKFLDNRTHEKPQRSPIKYKPDMVYGISVESPNHFQTPFTIVNSDTYINPYLEFQQKRGEKIPGQKVGQIKPEWTKKTNLHLVEEQKILSSNLQDPSKSPVSRYRDTYKEQINQKEHRFKITRGQFTDFIEKNNRYKSIGPIHGKQRTGERIETTKKSVWLKPDVTSSDKSSKMLYSTYFQMMRQSSLKDGLLSNDTKISNFMTNNSNLISEKGRIRDNRQKMNASFQKNLEERKHLTQFKVELPKLHSQMLVRDDRHKIRPKANFASSEDIADIDEFENRLHRQFR